MFQDHSMIYHEQNVHEAQRSVLGSAPRSVCAGQADHSDMRSAETELRDEHKLVFCSSYVSAHLTYEILFVWNIVNLWDQKRIFL